jgi:hypothetical protein
MAGSNVLIGGQGGQLDFLSSAGYAKLGLPGDMVRRTAPNAQAYRPQLLGARPSTRQRLPARHQGASSVGTAAGINGAVIPARSENDTGNNPHNPMYGIARGRRWLAAVADRLTRLRLGRQLRRADGHGQRRGRPTKVDRPSDVTGLVDTGKLVGLLGPGDAVAVMESILSAMKLGSEARSTRSRQVVTRDAVIKDLVRCNYVKAPTSPTASATPARSTLPRSVDRRRRARHLHAAPSTTATMNSARPRR